MSDVRTAWNEVSHALLLTNAGAMMVYRLGTAVVSEQDAEIMRLKDELARIEDRQVIHAPGAKCLEIIASGEADGEAIGTILRSTDGKGDWERTDGGWQMR